MPSRRRGVAVLGGSFDRLHVGHHALLRAAFAAADRVGIGLTTDAYLAEHPKPLRDRIAPYAVRRRRLAAFLRREFPRRRWWIVPLSDSWGSSVAPGVDVLIASRETAGGARSVNQERRRRRLPALSIQLIPLVLAEDGLPVSSRRIRSGTIDPEGHRTRTLSVVSFGAPASDLPRIRSAFQRAFPGVPVRVRRGRAGAAPRRRSMSSARGAASMLAQAGATRADYGVGIAGLGSTRRGSSRTRPWIAVTSARGSLSSPLPVPQGSQTMVEQALARLLRR